jgi:transposase-like protein
MEVRIMQVIPSVVEEMKGRFRFDLLSEEACRDWFLQKIRPDGAFCPKCHKEVPGEKSRKSFWELRRVKCTGCHVLFLATTDTILEGLKIDFRELYLILFLTGCGLSAHQVVDRVGVTRQTVCAWLTKFKFEDPRVA